MTPSEKYIENLINPLDKGGLIVYIISMDIKKQYINKVIDVNSEYGKKYLDIVSKGDTGAYTRIHHIVPASYFKDVLGDDDPRAKGARGSHESNLVSLTDGHHLLAHFYLMKCAKKCIARQMRRAFHVMYSMTHATALTENDVLKLSNELDTAYCSLTRIEQWTKDGKFVATYPTIQAAAVAVNAWPPEISEVCRGNKLSSHGYVWVYEGTDPKKIHFPDIHGNNVRRRIAQYTLSGNLITVHKSMCAAAKSIGVCLGSIEQNVQRRSVACKGYVFAYEDVPVEKINFPGEHYVPNFSNRRCCKPKKVAQYDMEGNRICIYNTVSEAGRALNVDSQGISRCGCGFLQSSHGYRWSYNTRLKKLPPLIQNKSGPTKKEKKPRNRLTRPI